MTVIERAAWVDLAIHLSARAGGYAAIARQERENAARVEQRYPDEARIRRASADHHEAKAKVAAELAAVAKQNAEGA